MNNTEKRFYTLQFSETASVSVSRFAWVLNKPNLITRHLSGEAKPNLKR